jgi:hypothetical protein
MGELVILREDSGLSDLCPIIFAAVVIIIVTLIGEGIAD